MAFVQNQWYAAVWATALGDEPKGLRILGKPIVLFRTADGGVAVMDDLCPHRFVPLHLGKVVDGQRIRCMYHGLEFDGSGACVHNPHTRGRIPAAAKVKRYTALQRHGMVWVWLGSGVADPSLIPSLWQLDSSGAPPADGPHYVPLRAPFSLVMKAHYGLIAANLLDLSHACTLHESLLGNLEGADAELALEETPHGFIMRRLAVGKTLPELASLLSEQGLSRGDTWADMELIGTTCFVNHLGVNASGRGRQGGTGLLGFNILTPIDEETTLYHADAVLIDPPHRSAEDNARIGQRLSELGNIAFDQQDKVVLEAQQRAMSDPSLETSRPALFDIDVGASRYVRRLQAALEAEAEAEAAG